MRYSEVCSAMLSQLDKLTGMLDEIIEACRQWRDPWVRSRSLQRASHSRKSPPALACTRLALEGRQEHRLQQQPAVASATFLQARLSRASTLHASVRGSLRRRLHALIGAKCPLTGRSFTQSELQDQLLTMCPRQQLFEMQPVCSLPPQPRADWRLVAGHKTTTLLLTWALYHIGRSPQVEKSLCCPCWKPLPAACCILARSFSTGT